MAYLRENNNESLIRQMIAAMKESRTRPHGDSRLMLLSRWTEVPLLFYEGLSKCHQDEPWMVS